MKAPAWEGENVDRRLWSVPLACLLIIMASVASAAQPLAEERVERTTEIPGSGVGVTLPVEWRVWSASHRGAGEDVVIASDVGGKRTCSFRLLPGVSSAQAEADATAEAVSRRYEIERTTHEVPAGTAIRVSYRYEPLPDEARFVQHEYYLDVPSGVVSAYCGGDEPPADSWLSVIEAIAPLAADPSPSAPFDPRVEVASHGFAVDFPAEWLVRSWGGPGPVFGGSLVLRAVTVARVDGSGGYECFLEDDTVLPDATDADSLEEWRETLITYAEVQERRTSDPVATETDLPSGRAVRADWKRWSGEPAIAWVLLDSEGHAAATLLCRSDEPPEDGWRSIAETFEFVEAEA